MKITVVVVNYRTWPLVSQLIELLKDDPIVGEIIIVDNSPGETSWGGMAFPGVVHYIANAENVGFAAAVNQGVRLATRRYLAFINPDVRPTDGCLRQLYETATAYKAALVGPRFYWDEEKTFRLPPATGSCLWWEAARLWAEAHPLDAHLFQRHWCLRHDAFWAASSPFPDVFLSGALLLVDRQALALAEGKIFDERFFLYYEDTDLCARALLSGLRLLCEPRAEAIHYWNQSPVAEEHKRRLMGISHEIFWKKYYGSFPLEFPLPAAEVRNGLPCQSPPLMDLDEVWEPPSFPTAAQEDGTPMYLEFAVSPLFFPFAQALVTQPAVRFPRSLWDRLAPGTYYCRLRDPLGSSVKVWKWTKQGP